MRWLIFASLALNIAVLVPVCFGLLTGAAWTVPAYGPDSAARGILLAVYLAILVGSAGLMFHPVPTMVATLLGLQVIYKLTTPFTTGSLSNPVVVSNLCIAAFHCITLVAIMRSGRL
jgi:hypothetical protein